MKLTDLESIEPDWPLIIVYSDYLEDNDNLLQATALRWLYQYNHWPQSIKGSYWVWYNLPSYLTRTLITSYYCTEHEDTSRNNSPLYISWRMATLPPEFPLKDRTIRESSFKEVMEAYLDIFPEALKNKNPLTPSLLSTFQDKLPRSLEDIHQCNYPSHPQPPLHTLEYDILLSPSPATSTAPPTP